MSVTLTPHDSNKTILIYTLEGGWTWAQFLAVDSEVWEYFEKTDKRIDLIFDLSHSSHIPLGLANIIHRAGNRTAPPSRGLAVIIKPPSIVPIILGALRRLYPKAATIYRTADTLQDALKLILADLNNTSD